MLAKPSPRIIISNLTISNYLTIGVFDELEFVDYPNKDGKNNIFKVCITCVYALLLLSTHNNMQMTHSFCMCKLEPQGAGGCTKLDPRLEKEIYKLYNFGLKILSNTNLGLTLSLANQQD